MKQSLLIWDSEEQIPAYTGVKVLWQEFGSNEAQNLFSLPQIVEEKAEQLKARYLAWVYEFAETKIRGKRLLDQLEFRPGFSYWWMTRVAYRDNAFSSPFLADLIKLFALEDLCKPEQIGKLEIYSSNNALCEIVADWCKKNSIHFQRLPQHVNTRAKKSLYQRLPLAAQASLFFVHYVFKRWPLRQSRDAQIHSDAEITIIDYPFSPSKNSATAKNFVSSYWPSLIDLFERSNWKANWFHHFIGDRGQSSSSETLKSFSRFNQASAYKVVHSALDAPLSFSLLAATVFDYLKLFWLSFRLRSAKQHFCTTKWQFNFFPLFQKHWYDSLRGPHAVQNCFYLNNFACIFKKLPQQKLGFYLQENQPWEMALIYFWKTFGHGKLVGVAHTTVRYWDLRYFYDPRTYHAQRKNALPMPHFVALNGQVASKLYRDAAYPPEQLIELEALRYLHLNDLTKSTAQTAQTGLRVLVFGDYVAAATRQQMQILVEASARLPRKATFYIKAHPDCPIHLHDYPSLAAELIQCSLPQALAQCDVAYTSNITSAAVEAYCAGVKVISVLDAKMLNVSPLRGCADVCYVSSAQELAEALVDIQISSAKPAENFFCLDVTLPRWQHLVQQHLSV